MICPSNLNRIVGLIAVYCSKQIRILNVWLVINAELDRGIYTKCIIILAAKILVVQVTRYAKTFYFCWVISIEILINLT